MNQISRQAALFGKAAARAALSLEMALAYFQAFSAIGDQESAEFARENAHASVDAMCDALRSAHKTMGDE